MGRLSLTGIDNVLVGKMQTVIDSVNARIKLDLEHGAAVPTSSPPPSITYEQFVEELDLGDSFTSVLFEALVKEMAERRLRSQVTDKRMISRRTQRLLNNLHDQSRVLRHESRAPPPRSYYTDPIPGLAWEEEELLRTSMLDGDEDDDDGLETGDLLFDTGSRRSAELFDSYYSRPLRRHAPFFNRTSSATTPGDSLAPPPSGIFDDVWGLMRGGAVGNPVAATSHQPSAASVTRANSIRRAARSRVDFSDFAARRRQSTRLGLVPETEASTQRSDESATVVAGSSAGASSSSTTTGAGTASTSANAGAPGSSAVPHPPWNLPSLGGSVSSSRAMSGTGRLRRAIGGLPPEAFLLRSVTSPPPFFSREANDTPLDEHPGDQWVHLQNLDVTPSSLAMRMHLAAAGASGEQQMLTPRSTTPDDAAAVVASGAVPTAPAALPTPVPTSVASVAGSQVGGSP